jgi:hypothetical protein
MHPNTDEHKLRKNCCRPYYTDFIYISNFICKQIANQQHIYLNLKTSRQASIKAEPDWDLLSINENSQSYQP